MGPDGFGAAQVMSKGQGDSDPATQNINDDEFEELFGIGAGGLAGAEEEEDVVSHNSQRLYAVIVHRLKPALCGGHQALQQLNRLEKVVAGDVDIRGRRTELVGGGEWSALDAGVLNTARLVKGGKFLDVLEGCKPWLLGQPSENERGGHVADVIGARVVAYVCGEGECARHREQSAMTGQSGITEAS